MDFFHLKTLKLHTNAHAVRDRPSLKDGERQFRPGSFHELQDNNGWIHEFLKRVANSITLLKNIQTPHGTVHSLSELAHMKENTSKVHAKENPSEAHVKHAGVRGSGACQEE